MRGLGLLELWVLAGTSVAGDRCPTLLFVLKPKWVLFVYLLKDDTMEKENVLSSELKQFMKLHKLNLQQLLLIEANVFLSMSGAGYRMLMELLNLRERQ